MENVGGGGGGEIQGVPIAKILGFDILRST
jgi:hypothetical protein